MSASSSEANSSYTSSSPERKGCLPSEEDKINEAVNVGSIFLALESKFVNPRTLLNWLTTVDITNATRVAYKAVCLAIPPDDQYLEDKFHFLVKKPEYLSIGLGFGPVAELPDQKSPGTENPILAHSIEALTELNSNKTLRKISQLILAGDGAPAFVQSKLVLCYQARNFHHFRNFPANDYNVALVAADWTDRFRYNEQLPMLILKRVATLQEKAPLYYAGAAYKAYHKVAVKLSKDKLLNQLSRDELATFNDFFPNVVDTRVLEYTDLAYKIALLGNDIAGYVLGFPVQSMVPNEEQIHQALHKLQELGSEGYVTYIKQYVKKTYIPKLPFMEKKMVPDPSNSDVMIKEKREPRYPNDTDVTFEEIDNYVPFDIIACQIGDHLHRFSRTEADNLLETGKNPWTKEWLPIMVLSTIKARVEAANELGLPPARPLGEILIRVNNGTLFAADEVPKPPTSSDLPPLDADRPMVPSLFEALMAVGYLNGEWIPALSDEEDEGNGNLDAEDEIMTLFQHAVQPRGPRRDRGPDQEEPIISHGTRNRIPPEVEVLPVSSIRTSGDSYERPIRPRRRRIEAETSPVRTDSAEINEDDMTIEVELEPVSPTSASTADETLDFAIFGDDVMDDM